VEEWKQWREW
jgi:hypothetical protein